MDVSITEMYFLTRLMHLDDLAMIFLAPLIICPIIAIVVAIYNATSNDRSSNHSPLPSKWFIRPLIGTFFSAAIMSVLFFFNVDSNSEAAIIVAVPAISQLTSSEAIGKEVQEWNDLLQDAVDNLIDGDEDALNKVAK